MSHCTSFSFSYKDDQLAAMCFPRLGLKPSTEVVGEYGSNFAKLFSNIGYAGKRQKRAIVASSRGFHYFLIKDGEEYRLSIEKHGPITSGERITMRQMESQFRLTYVQLALERLAERFENRGTPSRFVRKDETIILEFGPSFDRSIKVTVTAEGIVEEEVLGVTGASCADLTGELESLLSLETAELKTTWKPEYQQQIEDEVVQVLRLQP